eukprot:GHVT01071623.1.p1 GENE.GHVT01071623.1~~GHVT01071623.1.p1  ORF type:complete len:630 (-),score=143.07 GHVT01071623.1:964-2853(-)
MFSAYIFPAGSAACQRPSGRRLSSAMIIFPPCSCSQHAAPTLWLASYINFCGWSPSSCTSAVSPSSSSPTTARNRQTPRIESSAPPATISSLGHCGRRIAQSLITTQTAHQTAAQDFGGPPGRQLDLAVGLRNSQQDAECFSADGSPSCYLFVEENGRNVGCKASASETTCEYPKSNDASPQSSCAPGLTPECVVNQNGGIFRDLQAASSSCSRVSPSSSSTSPASPSSVPATPSKAGVEPEPASKVSQRFEKKKVLQKMNRPYANRHGAEDESRPWNHNSKENYCLACLRRMVFEQFPEQLCDLGSHDAPPSSDSSFPSSATAASSGSASSCSKVAAPVNCASSPPPSSSVLGSFKSLLSHLSCYFSLSFLYYLLRSFFAFSSFPAAPSASSSSSMPSGPATTSGRKYRCSCGLLCIDGSVSCLCLCDSSGVIAVWRRYEELRKRKAQFIEWMQTRRIVKLQRISLPPPSERCTCGNTNDLLPKCFQDCAFKRCCNGTNGQSNQTVGLQENLSDEAPSSKLFATRRRSCRCLAQSLAAGVKLSPHPDSFSSSSSCSSSASSGGPPGSGGWGQLPPPYCTSAHGQSMLLQISAGYAGTGSFDCGLVGAASRAVRDAAKAAWAATFRNKN